MSTELIAIISLFVTVIIGFLGTILTVIALNNSTRAELKTDIKNEASKLDLRIDRLETRFESEIKELRGLILGLYNPSLFSKINKDKDAA